MVYSRKDLKMRYNDGKKRLIYYLAENFIKHGIVTSGNDFSINILGKVEHYYRNVKYSDGDLSVSCAIESLINVRKLLRKYRALQKTVGSINDEKIVVLEDAEEKLSEFLLVKYRIKEIAEEVSTIYDDADYYGVMIV
jgi:hypothetical protein